MTNTSGNGGPSGPDLSDRMSTCFTEATDHLADELVNGAARVQRMRSWAWVGETEDDAENRAEELRGVLSGVLGGSMRCAGALGASSLGVLGVELLAALQGTMEALPVLGRMNPEVRELFAAGVFAFSDELGAMADAMRLGDAGMGLPEEPSHLVRTKRALARAESEVTALLGSGEMAGLDPDELGEAIRSVSKLSTVGWRLVGSVARRAMAEGVEAPVLSAFAENFDDEPPAGPKNEWMPDDPIPQDPRELPTLAAPTFALVSREKTPVDGWEVRAVACGARWAEFSAWAESPVAALLPFELDAVEVAVVRVWLPVIHMGEVVDEDRAVICGENADWTEVLAFIESVTDASSTAVARLAADELPVDGLELEDSSEIRLEEGASE